MQVITSRDNPWVKQSKRLAQTNNAAYDVGMVWLEGEHLCDAALLRGWTPHTLVLTEGYERHAVWQARCPQAKHVGVTASVMAHISGMDSPPQLAMALTLPVHTAPLPGVATVVLDRLQDPGNVGSVLRTASAMGFAQVVALKGTAALWSPKVLRSGMGAHFNLRLHEGADAAALAQLQVPIYATSSHQGQWLHQTAFEWPMAWLMGHEGQGVSQACAAHAKHWVRIGQPGGEESLNVAAAAAICMYASSMAYLKV